MPPESPQHHRFGKIRCRRTADVLAQFLPAGWVVREGEDRPASAVREPASVDCRVAFRHPIRERSRLVCGVLTPKTARRVRITSNLIAPLHPGARTAGCAGGHSASLDLRAARSARAECSQREHSYHRRWSSSALASVVCWPNAQKIASLTRTTLDFLE